MPDATVYLEATAAFRFCTWTFSAEPAVLGVTQTLMSKWTRHLEHRLVDAPCQSRPPGVTIIVILLALLNLTLQRHNKRALGRIHR
ncbi:hypothetical protein [Pseudomonas sp. CC6-YY-74]|uniref:hypothetical protein n=1 Tax=Pseudomonas sp. CC6-YY-74 TaxID=1930532 RepID=UPI0009A173E5|nr:hypothetical protein [Pseudomonas sp. CC6-YY-74]